MATTYDKASLVMIPSGYKDDKLYAVKPTDGSGDFTFSRDGAGASPATRVNASGLIEKGRTNELTYSNAFDNAAWVKTNATITSGQSGYDGSSNAYLLQATASSASAKISQPVTITSVKTISVYAKAGSYDYVIVQCAGGTASYTWFDLTNGLVGTEVNVIESKIESVGGGWYRCSITAQGTYNGGSIYAAPSDGSVSVSAGNYIYIQDAQLEQGLVATDYIETTTAPVSAGLLGDMPRLDYSGGATCPSLLLEPSRVNVLSQSEYFDVSPYTSSFVTLTANSAVSPEGVQNAYNFVPTTDVSGNHRIYVGGGYSMQTASYSVFIKPNGHNYWGLREAATTGASIGFDFTDNSIITEYSTGGCTASNGKIEDYGNGWYRISGTFSFASATNQGFGLYAAAPTWTSGDVESVAWAGDGVSGAYIYGAQQESGNYVSSYIPTYGSASTRGADLGYVTGISDLIGQTEGTIFAEFEIPQDFASSEDHRFTISDGGAGNWIFVSINNIDNIRIFHRTNNISNIDTSETGVISHGTTYKVAFAYKSGSSSCYLNGTEIISSSATLPAPTANLSQINLTGDSSTTTSSPQIFGLNVKQRIQFKTRLTNAELAALTQI